MTADAKPHIEVLSVTVGLIKWAELVEDFFCDTDAYAVEVIALEKLQHLLIIRCRRGVLIQFTLSFFTGFIDKRVMCVEKFYIWSLLYGIEVNFQFVRFEIIVR